MLGAGAGTVCHIGGVYRSRWQASDACGTAINFALVSSTSRQPELPEDDYTDLSSK